MDCIKLITMNVQNKGERQDPDEILGIKQIIAQAL